MDSIVIYLYIVFSVWDEIERWRPIIIQGLKKDQTPGAAVRTILPGWFEQLVESFLTKKFTSNGFACRLKPVTFLLKLKMKPVI